MPAALNHAVSTFTPSERSTYARRGGPWAGPRASTSAIQARRTGTEGLDTGEPSSALVSNEPSWFSLAWDRIGAPHAEEEFPRDYGFQLPRAQGLGGQERDAFHAVEVAIEYAADGAVGTGDRPQYAPLLRERGPASLTSDGLGNGNSERARSFEPQKALFRK